VATIVKGIVLKVNNDVGIEAGYGVANIGKAPRALEPSCIG
jgi:hypothetical protein